MPLDDIGGRSHSFLLNDAPTWSTLGRTLDDLGIAPIPLDALDRHRIRQVQLHPPSFFYRHRWIAPLLTVSSFGVSVAAAAVVGTSAAAVTVILAGMLPALAGIILASRKVRGEAYWVERRLLERDLAAAKVPPAISRLAQTVKRELAPARLILGELRQDTVVLDPYLIVEFGEERVVLGIWDGDEVIACAGPLPFHISRG